MKARSNAKLMMRRQARLWEQRRLLHVRQLRVAAQSELNEQWRVRASQDNRTSAWWSCADAADETRPDTTYSSTNNDPNTHDDSSRPNLPEQHPEVARASVTRDGGGCPVKSTIACSSSAESWRDLLMEKTCNGTWAECGPMLAMDGSRRQQRPEAHDEQGAEHDGWQVATGGDRIHHAEPHGRDLGRDESRQAGMGAE
ncbi:hypothetical protein PR002_g12304 [Phytophthora rubi]|uniref:Uncharacterized protein n=1 Tax=Phytophthora rubi TaxID=129364 RepID=A0A6A3LSE6_9STRA|nr:hypothetical protein PR002_g12304 [Phytophthora rubi]